MRDKFYFHVAHGHFHFPLASFGLYTVKSDGTVGNPVALSPKNGFCIADSNQVDPTFAHSPPWVQYAGDTCTDPTCGPWHLAGLERPVQPTRPGPEHRHHGRPRRRLLVPHRGRPRREPHRGERVEQRHRHQGADRGRHRHAGEPARVPGLVRHRPVGDRQRGGHQPVDPRLHDAERGRPPRRLRRRRRAVGDEADGDRHGRRPDLVARQAVERPAGHLGGLDRARHREAHERRDHVDARAAPAAGTTPSPSSRSRAPPASVRPRPRAPTTGGQSVALATTRAGSWVMGVGNDGDRPIQRVPGAGPEDGAAVVVDVEPVGAGAARADPGRRDHRHPLRHLPAQGQLELRRGRDHPGLVHGHDRARHLRAAPRPRSDPTTPPSNWTTDEPSTSQVDYGPTPSFGSSTPVDPSLVTSHSRSLSGLSANTTYYCRLRSADPSGNVATPPRTASPRPRPARRRPCSPGSRSPTCNPTRRSSPGPPTSPPTRRSSTAPPPPTAASRRASRSVGRCTSCSSRGSNPRPRTTTGCSAPMPTATAARPVTRSSRPLRCRLRSRSTAR